MTFFPYTGKVCLDISDNLFQALAGECGREQRSEGRWGGCTLKISKVRVTIRLRVAGRVFVIHFHGIVLSRSPNISTALPLYTVV